MTPRRMPEFMFLLRIDVRRRILVQLAEAPKSTQQIAEALRTPISTIRGNIKKLEPFGLVIASRGARSTTYRLADMVTVSHAGDDTILTVDTPDGGMIRIKQPSSWYGLGSGRRASGH